MVLSRINRSASLITIGTCWYKPPSFQACSQHALLAANCGSIRSLVLNSLLLNFHVSTVPSPKCDHAEQLANQPQTRRTTSSDMRRRNHGRVKTRQPILLRLMVRIMTSCCELTTDLLKTALGAAQALTVLDFG